MTAHAVPDAQIQTGAGVDPTALDYALDHLRTVCTGYPVTEVRARLTRAPSPGRTTAVRAEATAVVHGHSIQASAVSHCARTSVDEVADRLAAKLLLACTR